METPACRLGGARALLLKTAQVEASRVMKNGAERSGAAVFIALPRSRSRSRSRSRPLPEATWRWADAYAGAASSRDIRVRL